MPLNINDSIDSLLKNINQDKVDVWCENQKKKRVSVEDFIGIFDDYSKDGLVSLLTAFSMAHNYEPGMSIEKSDESKFDLYSKLYYKRLQVEGYDDEEIEKKIMRKIMKNKNVNKLLDEEIKKARIYIKRK